MSNPHPENPLSFRAVQQARQDVDTKLPLPDSFAGVERCDIPTHSSSFSSTRPHLPVIRQKMYTDMSKSAARIFVFTSILS